MHCLQNFILCSSLRHWIFAGSTVTVREDVGCHSSLHDCLLFAYARDSVYRGDPEAEHLLDIVPAGDRDHGCAVVHHLLHPLWPQDVHGLPALHRRLHALLLRVRPGQAAV